MLHAQDKKGQYLTIITFRAATKAMCDEQIKEWVKKITNSQSNVSGAICFLADTLMPGSNGARYITMMEQDYPLVLAGLKGASCTLEELKLNHGYTEQAELCLPLDPPPLPQMCPLPLPSLHPPPPGRRWGVSFSRATSSCTRTGKKTRPRLTTARAKRGTARWQRNASMKGGSSSAA